MDYTVFGCKTNKYFAEKWLVHPHISDKNGYFIASCVVTDKAKAKWIKKALKVLPKLNENEKLYLSWCGNIRDGVVDPNFYEIYHELSDFQEKIEILPEDPSDFVMSEAEKKKMMQTKIRSLQKLQGKQLFTRKYLVVQTGCDNFCTFCLTVQARWRHKWRPIGEVVDEVTAFVDEWWKEIVLTGINLWAWGSGSSNNFEMSKFDILVETILRETRIERIRISSLGVEFFNEKVIALFANIRVNPYVHLSIQSGSTKILRAMNRHYTGERTSEVLTALRSIERADGNIINIGADLIVGFPEESDADFADTKNLVTNFHITQLHAFPFSAHIDHYNVPAGKFPNQVPNHIIQKRLKDLLKTGEDEYNDFVRKNHNHTLRVLVEKIGPNTFSGWSENYIACNETNFIPTEDSEIKRGGIIVGTLKKS